jgi:Protein of unknown function (DUF2889)
MSPLSAPVERQHLHTRRYEFQGYHRTDGLWDIEGRMTDTKTYGFANEWRGEIKPGEPIHDMWIRITLDDDMVVRDIEAKTAASPFQVCPGATPKYTALKGARVGPGWSKRVKDMFGGPIGCTHQTEMLVAIATVAYQTIFSAKKKWGGRDETTQRPKFLDTCHAFASDGEIVKKNWPEFYTGS